MLLLIQTDSIHVQAVPDFPYYFPIKSRNTYICIVVRPKQIIYTVCLLFPDPIYAQQANSATFLRHSNKMK